LGGVTAGDGSAVEAGEEAEADGAGAGEAAPGPAVAAARCEAAGCGRVLGVDEGPVPPE